MYVKTIIFHDIHKNNDEHNNSDSDGTEYDNDEWHTVLYRVTLIKNKWIFDFLTTIVINNRPG